MVWMVWCLEHLSHFVILTKLWITAWLLTHKQHKNAFFLPQVWKFKEETKRTVYYSLKTQHKQRYLRRSYWYPPLCTQKASHAFEWQNPHCQTSGCVRCVQRPTPFHFALIWILKQTKRIFKPQTGSPYLSTFTKPVIYPHWCLAMWQSLHSKYMLILITPLL